MKLESSSALAVMGQLEKWLSGYERLNTWEALGYNTKIQLGERFSLMTRSQESQDQKEIRLDLILI